MQLITEHSPSPSFSSCVAQLKAHLLPTRTLTRLPLFMQHHRPGELLQHILDNLTPIDPTLYVQGGPRTNEVLYKQVPIPPSPAPAPSFPCLAIDDRRSCKWTQSRKAHTADVVVSGVFMYSWSSTVGAARGSLFMHYYYIRSCDHAFVSFHLAERDTETDAKC